jgi:hypothetical protein
MKFEERKSKSKSALIGFLSSFAPPRGLDDAAMKLQVDGIADAFARRLPVTDVAAFESNIEKTFTAVRDDHKGYAWPVQSEFVEAMPRSVSSGSSAKVEFKRDRHALIISRINAGDPLPENWIWSSFPMSLVASGEVTRATLDNYRKGAVRSCQHTYGPEAYGIMQAKFGDIVAPYFSNEAAA